MTSVRLILLMALLGFPLSSWGEGEGEWPRFRGPNGSGLGTAEILWTGRRKGLSIGK